MMVIIGNKKSSSNETLVVIVIYDFLLWLLQRINNIKRGEILPKGDF